jgi:drug/metabolite transporter (DMT)-like permease
VVENIPPFQLAGMRQLLAGFLFCGYFLMKGHGFPPRQTWPRLFLLSLLMFTISNGFSTVGVRYIGSGFGSVLGAITALWLSLLGWYILKQPIYRTTYWGLFAGFVGILVISFDKWNVNVNKDFIWGLLLSLIATVSWPLGTIYNVKYAVNTNAWYSVGWQMLISGVFMTAISYTQPRVNWCGISLIGYIDLAILVLGGSVITFVCYMYVLQKLPAAQVSIYVYVNPIIAVLLSAYIFPDEKLTWLLGLGSLITLLGVYLVNKGSNSNR